jgi:quercetin 2,3-dioxygenase
VEILEAGDFQIMTAGSGIVHTEVIDQPTTGRLLQMWLNLPKKDRWVTPRVQNLRAEHVPEVDKNGTRLRVYSGSLSGLKSPILNYVPLLVAEFQMKPDVITAQFIPSDYSTFLYVLSGTVKVGEDRQILKQGETGWLDRHSIDGTSELILWSGSEGCRLVLYAGKPQDEEFVSEGPFIGDTHEDIKKVYTQYVLGKLTHIADVSTENKIDW